MPILRLATLLAAIGSLVGLVIDLSYFLSSDHLHFLARETPLFIVRDSATFLFPLSLAIFFFALYAKQKGQ